MGFQPEQGLKFGRAGRDPGRLPPQTAARGVVRRGAAAEPVSEANVRVTILPLGVPKVISHDTFYNN